MFSSGSASTKCISPYKKWISWTVKSLRLIDSLTELRMATSKMRSTLTHSAVYLKTERSEGHIYRCIAHCRLPSGISHKNRSRLRCAMFLHGNGENIGKGDTSQVSIWFYYYRFASHRIKYWVKSFYSSPFTFIYIFAQMNFLWVQVSYE